jgi:hypothetical protein
VSDGLIDTVEKTGKNNAGYGFLGEGRSVETIAIDRGSVEAYLL